MKFSNRLDYWGEPLVEDFKSSAKKFLSQGIEQTEIDSYFEDFKKLKDGSKIKDPSQKDIDIWAKRTWEDFKSFVDSLKTKQTKTQAKKIAKTEGAELVAENEGWYVYRITSHKACMMYGSNTKWCITQPNGKHWKDYNKNSNFYFLISKIEREDDWNKIAVQVFQDKEIYWDEIDEKHASLPASLKIPRFTREVPVEVNGELMTLDDFSNSHGLKVAGYLSLYRTPITSLPNGLKVDGDLNIAYTKITSLPNGLKVGGGLDLSYTQIKSLPDDLEVSGSLYLANTPIKSLPKDLKVGGYLDLRDTQIKSLPDGLKVGGYLSLYRTPIESLPKDLKVGGSLDLSGTKIKSLPTGLKVGGSLDLSGTKITSLPNGLEVDGGLYLRGTPIKSLPDDLKVGGNLHLYRTPITSLPDDLIVKESIFVDNPEKIQCSDELRRKLR